MLIAVAAMLELGLIIQYLSVTQTFMPPQEAVPTVLLALAMWCGATRVEIAGKRLQQSAAGVSESRIALKGMLGRTSWCNYFKSLPIRVELPGGFAIDSEMVATAAAAGVVAVLFFGLNPRVETGI